MTDKELIARLRDFDPHLHEWEVVDEAADRIEALVEEVKDERAAKFKMRDERDAAKIAASNYADFNHTWRKRAEAAEAVNARLREALEFYRNGFERKAKRSRTGLLLSVDYTPTQALLDDCGNRAIAALAGDSHD